MITSGVNWIPGELNNEQRGYIQVKGDYKCGGGEPLLRSRCPGNGATATTHPPNYDYKEHKQINVFFFFLNNDLCLSTIVVIIRKFNSSLALKVTHRNPLISFDNYLSSMASAKLINSFSFEYYILQIFLCIIMKYFNKYLKIYTLISKFFCERNTTKNVKKT